MLNQKCVFNIFVSTIHIHIIQKVLKFLLIYLLSYPRLTSGTFIADIFFYHCWGEFNYFLFMLAIFCQCKNWIRKAASVENEWIRNQLESTPYVLGMQHTTRVFSMVCVGACECNHTLFLPKPGVRKLTIWIRSFEI